MFTGIIETLAEVKDIQIEGSNIHFTLASDIANELNVDQSVSHNGVCLTVVKIIDDQYVVTAIEETLNKSNLGDLKVGDQVNIERCTKIGGRLDGHIVQGHVDQTGICTDKEDKDGSVIFTFQYNVDPRGYFTVEKGSITFNSISLTVFDSIDDKFSVAIIPYTLEHTNLKDVEPGDKVNLEFDIIGKYVARIMELRK